MVYLIHKVLNDYLIVFPNGEQTIKVIRQVDLRRISLKISKLIKKEIKK